MTSCSRTVPPASALLVFGLLLAGVLGGCRKAQPPELFADAPELRGELDAQAALLRGADSLDVGVRMRSLDLLIRLSPEPGGGQWGPRAVFDPSPSVQRLAVDALADRLPEPTSLGLLEGLASREGADPYVRGAAAFALGQAGHLGALSAVQASLAAETAHWRAAPLALGAASMGDAEAEAALVEHLSRGDFPLEIGFFLNCGRSGLTSLVPALGESAQRVEEELILPIAAALLMLEGRDGQALFKAALGAERAEQRMEAVDYLVLMPEEASTELLERARAGGPESVRVYAKMALIARGEESPKDALEALSSLDREQRQQAIWALSRHLAAAEDMPKRERKRLREALLTGLSDTELLVVIETVQGLALTGISDDRALLAGLVQDDPPLILEVEVAGAMLALEEEQRAG